MQGDAPRGPKTQPSLSTSRKIHQQKNKKHVYFLSQNPLLFMKSCFYSLISYPFSFLIAPLHHDQRRSCQHGNQKPGSCCRKFGSKSRDRPTKNLGFWMFLGSFLLNLPNCGFHFFLYPQPLIILVHEVCSWEMSMDISAAKAFPSGLSVVCLFDVCLIL